MPAGFTLVDAKGAAIINIRGDLVRPDALVILFKGRVFVATGEMDDKAFPIFREDFRVGKYEGTT